MTRQCLLVQLYDLSLLYLRVFSVNVCQEKLPLVPRDLCGSGTESDPMLVDIDGDDDGASSDLAHRVGALRKASIPPALHKQ